MGESSEAGPSECVIIRTRSQPEGFAKRLHPPLKICPRGSVLGRAGPNLGGRGWV